MVRRSYKWLFVVCCRREKGLREEEYFVFSS